MLTPFRFWCSKVLPLVYDDSLSYYELLCKVIQYLNNTMSDVNQLSELVQNFIDSGVVEEEVAAKLDEMVEDGTMAELINQEVFDQLNAQLSALEDRVDHLTDRSFIVFGDSYGMNDVPNGITNNFIDMAQEYLGIPDARWNNASGGGLGFAGGAGSWKDTVLTVASGMTEAERNAVTDVIFVGGRNDAYRYSGGSVTLSDINTNIAAAAANVKTSFPNARMHNAFIGRDWDAAYILGESEVYRLYNSAQNHYMDYYNGMENILHYRSLLRSDGTHPNMTGQYALAVGLVNCILNGSTNVVYEFSACTTTNQIGNNHTTTADTIRIYEGLYNGNVVINLIGDTIGSNSDPIGVDSYECNGSAGGALKICDLSGSVKACFRDMNSGYAHHVPCDMIVNATGGYQKISGYLVFSGSSIYWRAKDVASGGYITLTDIKSIQLPHVQFTYPAILA